MKFILQPWHVMILTLSAWINREEEKAIAYLRAENQVLREKLGKGRILGRAASTWQLRDKFGPTRRASGSMSIEISGYQASHALKTGTLNIG